MKLQIGSEGKLIIILLPIYYPLVNNYPPRHAKIHVKLIEGEAT